MSIFSAHLLKSRVVLIYFVPNSNCSKIFILSLKLKSKMKSFLGSLSCTRGHENWRKWIVWFFGSFMYSGSWKLEKNEEWDFGIGTWNFAKIRQFIFLQFSWPQVHETSQKLDNSFVSNFTTLGTYMKLHKNQMIHMMDQKKFLSLLPAASPIFNHF